MAESLVPGGAPVSLNEARGWLRLGATIDDAVVAGLVRAATSVCEAFIGRWGITNHQEAGAFRISGTASGLESEPTGGDAGGAQAPEPAAGIIWSIVVAIAVGGSAFRRWRG